MVHARITADPGVQMGKPCIRGTRITVKLVLRKLVDGRSFANILDAYPLVMEDDLRAALAFAADYLQRETILGLGEAPIKHIMWQSQFSRSHTFSHFRNRIASC
jgi:uncharacterized protein (DUF433 family)